VIRKKQSSQLLLRYGRAIVENTQKEHSRWTRSLVLNTKLSHSLTPPTDLLPHCLHPKIECSANITVIDIATLRGRSKLSKD